MTVSFLGSWLCQAEGEACDLLGMGEMMVGLPWGDPAVPGPVPLAGWAGCLQVELRVSLGCPFSYFKK